MSSNKFNKVNESYISDLSKHLDNDNVVGIDYNNPKELNKIDNKNKQSFEDYKSLYKDIIDMKYKQEYGYGADIDKDLWEDCAKELFLKSQNYILIGDEYKPKKSLDESKKIKSEDKVEYKLYVLYGEDGVYNSSYVGTVNNLEQANDRVKELEAETGCGAYYKKVVDGKELDENKELNEDMNLKYTYTPNEIRKTLLQDNTYTSEPIDVKYIDGLLKNIEKIESEIPLTRMTPMGGDDYSGFKGRGKVVTCLKDGRKFVAEEEDLALITAIELVVSDEIKEESKITEAEPKRKCAMCDTEMQSGGGYCIHNSNVCDECGRKYSLKDIEDKINTKEIKTEDYTNTYKYLFVIVLNKDNPIPDEFKDLSNNIANLIDLNNAEYPITFSNINTNVNSEDGDVFVFGDMYVQFNEDKLTTNELSDMLVDLVIADNYDATLQSVSVTEVSKKVTENRTSDDIKDIYEKDINRMLCMNNIDDIKDYLYDITESCNFDEAKSWLNGIKNYAGKNPEQNSEIIKSCDEILKDTFYENKKLNETIEYEKDYQAIFSEIDLKDIGSAVYDCIKECKLSEAAVQVILNKLHSSYGIVTESKEDDEYNYMLLNRLKSDCDYYLGNGNRNPKHLWAGNEQGQIDKMKELYNKLPEKPEWLTMEQIDDYARQMNVKELPSTENGTAEKEINDMLDRSFNLKNNVGIE